MRWYCRAGVVVIPKTGLRHDADWKRITWLVDELRKSPKFSHAIEFQSFFSET